MVVGPDILGALYRKPLFWGLRRPPLTTRWVAAQTYMRSLCPFERALFVSFFACALCIFLADLRGRPERHLGGGAVMRALSASLKTSRILFGTEYKISEEE